ncbi:MAG TPA: hypothetical protein DCW68_01705 [Rhodospirillaceae bacterium]|nr:MAG: hypothetical protein A2018_04670 [Alphaproteobacteria bacterium GWF2_58_20]HAU28813.1 hypothetical protein [Rhodospirillaceae bacterium]
MEILIKSRSVRSYHALGVMGKPVYASAERLRLAISKRLGDGHAHLFAIPRLSDDGGSMDWYAAGEGAVVSWVEATQEQRKHIADRVEEMLVGLKDLANTPAAEEDQDGEDVRQLLRQALFVPERMENVFLVGEQPVVTFWGYVTHDMKGDNDILFHLREEYTGHGDAPTVREDHAKMAEDIPPREIASTRPPHRMRKIVGQSLAVLLPLFALAAGGALLMEKMGGANGLSLPHGAKDAPIVVVKPPVEKKTAEMTAKPSSAPEEKVQEPVKEEASGVFLPEEAQKDMVIPEVEAPLNIPEIPDHVLRDYESGMARLQQGNLIEAMDSLQKAADAGYAEAMAAYADLKDPVVAQRMGRPMGLADGDEALRYYRKAEEAGLARVVPRRERLEEYMKSGQGPTGGGYRNEAW